jgi:hypothetical protein
MKAYGGMKVLSRLLVTNNAFSGLDERVYLLLIYTTRNLYVIIALSVFLHCIIHCYTHTLVLSWKRS